MARILVAGGSLGGLFAAGLLLRAGHDVLVLEKSPSPLDGRGAGIVTHPPLLKALEQVGARVDDSLGVRVAERRVYARSGAVEASLPLKQTLTSWGRLYQLLREQLSQERYRLGMEVVDVEEDGTGVTAHCHDGSKTHADLLIACDGLRSCLREKLAPEVQPSYAGYIAWRGVCDEALLSRKTLDSLFGYFGFCLPAGEQMLGYPVAGAANCTQVGHRRYNFVWYRACAQGSALEALLTDEDGARHPLGIAPHKVGRHHVAQMRADARDLLAPQFLEVVEKTPQPFFQPIYDVCSTRLAFGRVALLGDAAFVARPHVGMGVTKAAEDAAALAHAVALHGPTPVALEAYENARLPIGYRVVERARELGAYMQQQGKGASGASVTVHRDAQRVLADTAVEFPARAAPLPGTAPLTL
ncbi:MAG: FAD binding domain-containing protein [Burkholderiaceae bacterium]|jgi:2-polyprenyl-6-methoxyphenol hydroxylase-like FAD-dependent oxidoreductase